MDTSKPVPCSPFASAANRVLFLNMGDNVLAARNVEALLFVNMGDNALNARNVEALLFVNMGDDAFNAKNVEAPLFFNMGDCATVTMNALAEATGRCTKCPLEHSSLLLLNHVFFFHCTITPAASSSLLA